MHHALLIDEVLQLIFDYCAAEPIAESRRTFYQLARCCKAWKDPALDRLWARIDSSSPLLSLLPCADDKGMPASDIDPVFTSYARRVKEITYRDAQKPTSADSLEMVLPRLQAVTISHDGCYVPSSWKFSPHLKHISMNAGLFHTPERLEAAKCNSAEDLLKRIHVPSLRSLRFRGCLTSALSGMFASFTHLTDLTLHTHILECETFAAIATFPNLRSLTTSANGIRDQELDLALAQKTAPCFPALESLDLGGQVALLKVLFSYMPDHKLTRFRMAADCYCLGSTFFERFVEQLVQKTSRSLRELTIQDLTEYLWLEPPMRGQLPPEWFGLSLLHPLAACKELRKLELTLMIPPSISDTDVETLGKWWPHLEDLNLGTYELCYLPPEWRFLMTPRVFEVVATHLPRLQQLTLPVRPTDLLTSDERPTFSSELKHKTLRALAIGDVSNAAACASELVQAIVAIFPSLDILDCPAQEITEQFAVLTGSA
ncbi:hypothetical protein GY45DRAFT_1319082 [Cubamyces sp. BRFM 1775]|nr:hypothetical protein GY45DRAFT_1319082 [Cubamyces sp. BRFM 1775]